MTKISDEHAMVSYINKQRGTNHKDYQNCLFACFLSQKEPKKVIQALVDSIWVEAMQEELLQFKLQKVWTLVDLPNGKRAIGTKWVFRNKKDGRGIVVRNKARLMDVKSTFLYGTIKEEVYVCQPPSFEDPHFPDKVYKVEKTLYGLHKSPRAWYETLSTYLIENGFRRGTIDKTLFIKKDKGDILLVQVYVDDIIFGSTKKSLCDQFEGLMHKRSLMYLTASRPNIMFVVCACARFQVTPKTSHIHAVKRIFRYLKGQPKLGLWYPRDSPFNLEDFSDSDYVKASLDRKSTTGGCQFLRRRLISWQCKKQTIVSNSTTEAEYVAVANCCGQVLWIQNQMLDYGFNFINTKIYIDNESTICIMKNLVFHSKTKHIEIRHHFIRDSYEKKLIQVIKIHTDHNVADLLTKAFDVSRPTILGKPKGSLRYLSLSGPIHLVANETVYKEWKDRIERAATTTSSLEVEQDSGNINRTQSIATLNESFPQGTGSGSGPRCQVTILGLQMLKLGLRLHLDSPMIHLSQELTHLKVGRTAIAKVKMVNGERQLQALIDKKNVVITETSIRSDLNLEDAGGNDCFPIDTVFEELARMGAKTTAWNEFSSTMASTIICFAINKKFNLSNYIFDAMCFYITMTEKETNEESVPKHSYDPSQSGEDRIQLHELMNLCTKLSNRVLALETTKTAQALEIASLKSRVKKLEKKASKRTHKPKRLYRGRSDDKEVFDTDALIGDEVFAENDMIEKEHDVITRKVSDVEILTTAGITIPVGTAEIVSTNEIKTSAASSTIVVSPPVITKVEITLAQTLAELKSAKSKVVIQEPIQSTVTIAPLTIPKAKGITFRDAGETTTRTPTSVSSSSIKDKGKAKMVELEVPLNKKDQIRLDEELARRLDAEEQEAARLKRENVKSQEQANLAKIEEWDNVQAMMDVDYELCKRLQEQEQGELTIKEKSKLFMELMNERKRHFAKLIAEEKRRKLLTKCQKKNQMCTYLKNMGGFTHNQLKNKSYEEIQKAFDKTMGWINNFKPMDSEEVKSSEKKAEGSKKKSIEAKEDDEAEMKKHMEIVQDKEEIATDAIPLATKPTMIVEYKIVKEGQKGLYHLIRAYGNSNRNLKIQKMNIKFRGGLLGLKDFKMILRVTTAQKSLQFRRVEESESDNLFHDHIQGEGENAEDVQMADHLRPMEELLQIPIVVSSSGGTSTQIDAITALTKKVKALEYHIPSMRETYDHNQEAAIQLMQNQMGQMAEALQENPLGVLPSNTVTDPRAELKAITTMDGLTLDGSFIPHSNFLVYQEKEQEPETITKVVEISSSQITPLVPPPETPPLSTPKMKENLEPNPHQPPIPCPTRYYEAFCFNVDHQKEKSSGSSTSYFDHSLPDYEAFRFDIDHHEEKSSGSTISHYHPSLLEYESFYFDLSIDPLPPAEGVILVMRSSQMNSLTSYLHRRVYSKRSHILPLNDFSPISFAGDLLLTDPSEIKTFLSFPFENEDKVFDPGILLVDGVFSFTRKSPHLLNDNFKIDKRQISSEISLKIKSLICFHPKGKEIRGESS
ncbi:putative ribonuclease H-like domain-containing protein [Tanacetum coccineum]